MVVRAQKTRLARIHAAKALANKTFLRGKQKAEALLLARESGLENTDDLNDVDVFQLQHHHLLTCLERTTVSLAVSSFSRLTSLAQTPLLRFAVDLLCTSSCTTNPQQIEVVEFLTFRSRSQQVCLSADVRGFTCSLMNLMFATHRNRFYVKNDVLADKPNQVSRQTGDYNICCLVL